MEQADRDQLRESALRLLARREHSQVELARKLGRRGWPASDVGSVIDELAAEKLQSDQRFAEGYARSRAAKHYGPMRIRAELAERGIDRGLVDRTLSELEVNWFELAAEWYSRRYRDEPPADIREKSRRQQALARRGFAHEHVRDLMD